MKIKRLIMSDVLTICSIYKSKLLGGSRGLNNIIYSVNIFQDLKMINETTKGTFLLINSDVFDCMTLNSVKDFIIACSKNNIAGIGIEQLQFKDIDINEIINLANNLDIPLISIFSATSFSSIVSKIYNMQSKLINDFQNIYDKLMEIMLNGPNIEKMVDVLAQTIKRPILISLDIPKSEIINFEFTSDILKKSLLKNIKTYTSLYNNNSNFNMAFEKNVESINDSYITRYTKPLIINQVTYGHMFIWDCVAPLDSLDSLDFSIIDTVLNSILQELIKKVSIIEVENNHRKAFLDKLLSNDIKDNENGLEKAYEFNINKTDSFISFLITVEKNQSIYSPKTQFMQKVFYYIEGLIREKELTGIIANDSQSIYFILSFNPTEDINDIIEDFSKALEDLLEKKLHNIIYRIGVGRCYEGLENIRCSYEEAKNSIGIGNRLNKNSTIFYDKLGIYTLLCHDGLNNELELFYNNTIKKLVDHDKRKSTELVKTLEVYFQCNGNLNKIAKVLFTHYNTILYRINRINEITGMDLKNEENRLNLEIALRIMHMLKVPC